MIKYSYSIDEERYHGQHDSIEEAVYEAFNCYGLCEGDPIHIGGNVAPPAPEDQFEAEDWLEIVVRKVTAGWPDRHGLRPQFWNIEYVGRYTIVDGKVVKL